MAQNSRRGPAVFPRDGTKGEPPWPQFVKFTPPAPPAAAASPVIPFRVGQLPGDDRSWRGEVRPKFYPFPYFEQPALAAANPVIPIRTTPWRAFTWPEERSYSWFGGKHQSPRYFPLVIFQETFTAYESFLQFDAAQYSPAGTVFFEVILKSAAGAEVKARLFNITDSVAVAASDITTTSTNPTRLRSAALALAGTKEYRAEVRQTAGETTTLKAARLIVQQ